MPEGVVFSCLGWSSGFASREAKQCPELRNELLNFDFLSSEKALEEVLLQESNPGTISALE